MPGEGCSGRGYPYLPAEDNSTMLSILENEPPCHTPPPPQGLLKSHNINIIETKLSAAHNPPGIELASGIKADQEPPVRRARHNKKSDRNRLWKTAIQQTRLWSIFDRISKELCTPKSDEKFITCLKAIYEYCSTVNIIYGCTGIERRCCLLRNRLLVKASSGIMRINDEHRPQVMRTYLENFSPPISPIDPPISQRLGRLVQAMKEGPDAYIKLLTEMANDDFNCRDIAALHGISEPGIIAHIEITSANGPAGKKAAAGENCRELIEMYGLTTRYAWRILETRSLFGPAWNDLRSGMKPRDINKKYGYVTRAAGKELIDIAKAYDTKTPADSLLGKRPASRP